MYGYRFDDPPDLSPQSTARDEQARAEATPSTQHWERYLYGIPSQAWEKPALQAQAVPVELPAPSAAPRTGRNWIKTFVTSAVLGLVLVTAMLGSGAAGAALALRSLPEPQPVVITPPPSAANLAGAVYNQVNPAVVQVSTERQRRSGSIEKGTGSGVVIDATGLILTNYHVIEDADTITVLFSTGEERQSEVHKVDRANDLAVLTVQLPAGVPTAPLGNSDTVAVGEVAIAIGSPFGLNQTITQGIISAVHRDWSGQSGSGGPGQLIQTDASINPGNSGGPLLNAQGEVIGINTMIQSPIYGSVGIGFAVPINTAKPLLF